MNITCAICNKLVDRYEFWQDYNRAVVRLKVWCHGDTDQCEIPYDFLIEAGQPLTQGVAFTGKRIS